MKKEIVIIGGGFAGLNVANELANDDNFHITLVDKNNYNFFPPLLYQVATGFLEVSNVSYPFRKFFQGKRNISFRLGELLRIVPNRNKVSLTTGELFYDYLVLATGTESNYFGIENIKKNSLPLKTVDEALELRNYLLQAAEKAVIETDPEEREKLTTIVIAGGGPTGVEVAGMLAEMRKNILEKDYPELRGKKMSIYLIDGAPVLLTPMSKESQKYTYDSLVKMGVKVKLNKQVKDYKDDAVIFADGDFIKTKVLIWTAGVVAKVFEGIPNDSYGRGKRLVTDEFHKVKNTNNIYAIGDTSLQTHEELYSQGHPQLAQVAMQQGKNLARNFKAIIKEKPLKAFSYVNKGSMAIIGRNKAVAELHRPKLNLHGFVAWTMWLFIHLFSLIKSGNKVKTFYNWGVAFFTKDQSLRMIIRPSSQIEERLSTNHHKMNGEVKVVKTNSEKALSF